MLSTSLLTVFLVSFQVWTKETALDLGNNVLGFAFLSRFAASIHLSALLAKLDPARIARWNAGRMMRDAPCGQQTVKVWH